MTYEIELRYKFIFVCYHKNIKNIKLKYYVCIKINSHTIWR